MTFFCLFFSHLRHPQVVLLMAVCIEPMSQNVCLVLEPAEFGSLNHLLHATQVKMDLPKRVHILLDVSEAMIYLHNHSLLHCFLNSFSVLITETFRAKIGNLEYCMEDSNEEQPTECEAHKNWMAPELLFHEPFTTTGDVYRFVRLFTHSE